MVPGSSYHASSSQTTTTTTSSSSWINKTRTQTVQFACWIFSAHNLDLSVLESSMSPYHKLCLKKLISWRPPAITTSIRIVLADGSMLSSNAPPVENHYQHCDSFQVVFIFIYKFSFNLMLNFYSNFKSIWSLLIP